MLGVLMVGKYRVSITNYPWTGNQTGHVPVVLIEGVGWPLVAVSDELGRMSGVMGVESKRSPAGQLRVIVDADTITRTQWEQLQEVAAAICASHKCVVRETQLD